MVGGGFYVLIYIEVRCSLPNWHWCQSFSDAWHHTVPVMPVLLSLAFFFLLALLCLFILLHWNIGWHFQAVMKNTPECCYTWRNRQGVEFNWQVIVDGGLMSTFSGLWRVTQLGRCQLLALGWTEVLQLTRAVLTRSPLPLVGALTPHSHRHPRSGAFSPIQLQVSRSTPKSTVIPWWVCGASLWSLLWQYLQWHAHQSVLLRGHIYKLGQWDI